MLSSFGISIVKVDFFRKRLDLSDRDKISLCVMPGSRAEEVRLLVIFLEAIDKFTIKNNIGWK